MNTGRWQPIVHVCMWVSVQNRIIFHLPLCLKPIHLLRQFPSMQLVRHMALCPGRGGYVTGGGGGENDGVRSLCFLQKPGTIAGEAAGCRTGCKQQRGTEACVWESLLLVHSRPPCTGTGSMWKVTNAPKAAPLMKTIGGRVANAVWVVCLTQRWLRSRVGRREEVVCKNTSYTFASKIIASFSFGTELCFAGMRWDLEAEEHEHCIGCVCKISGPGGEVTWVSSQETFGREGRTHGATAGAGEWEMP